LPQKAFAVLKQQPGEANVKPTFCHEAPPTSEVGQARRLYGTNDGGFEATVTGGESK
jgi:hypothetical protein